MRTMLPPLAMSFTFSTTLKALVESRPEVGSSRNKRDGLWIMSIPMETLRFSPPETPLLPSLPMYVYVALCKIIHVFKKPKEGEGKWKYFQESLSILSSQAARGAQ